MRPVVIYHHNTLHKTPCIPMPNVWHMGRGSFSWNKWLRTCPCPFWHLREHNGWRWGRKSPKSIFVWLYKLQSSLWVRRSHLDTLGRAIDFYAESLKNSPSTIACQKLSWLFMKCSSRVPFFGNLCPFNVTKWNQVKSKACVSFL